jgi:hypothetical protein
MTCTQVFGATLCNQKAYSGKNAWTLFGLLFNNGAGNTNEEVWAEAVQYQALPPGGTTYLVDVQKVMTHINTYMAGVFKNGKP